MAKKADREYIPVNLKYQYTEYTGKEKWFIITDLTEEALRTRYPEIRKYEPFLLLDKKMGEPILDSIRNDGKFQKRSDNYEDAYGYVDGETEIYHEEPCGDGFEDSFVFSEVMKEALAQLPPIQRRRFILYAVYGYSTTEIAEMEGVSRCAAISSIATSKMNMQNFLKKFQ